MATIKYAVEMTVGDKYADRAAVNLETAIGTLKDTIGGLSIKTTRIVPKEKAKKK